MSSRIGLSVLSAIGLLLGVSASVSAAPASLPGKPLATSVDASLVPASFFGRPYPHGYTSWGPCIRYVPVETAYGVKYRRVSVCRSRR